MLIIFVSFIVTLLPVLLPLVQSQSDAPLRYQIVEELPVGSTVADLLVDAGLKRKYTADVLAQLEFRLLTPPAVPLTVNPSNGLLTTAGRIDRDELAACKDREKCELTLDVTVRPARYFQIIKVTVAIDDLNDNSPRFRDTTTTVGVRESAAPGTSFALPVATDVDSPPNGVRAYELIDVEAGGIDAAASTGALALSIVPRRDGSLDPRLVVRRPLDRERRAEYRLRLVAYDGGRPPLSSSVDILVQVLDSNDNSPVFDVPPGLGYEVNVTENVAVGTVLLRVRATDADEGLNGEVVYQFSTNTQSTYGSLFSIDNQTGEISVKSTLDHERHPVYQLAVVAQDRGPDSMPTDVAVILRVIDVNDNPPSITVNTLGAKRPASQGAGPESVTESTVTAVQVAEVPENLPSGTFVAHVSVVDPDSGEFGRVECNLTEPAFSLMRRGKTTEFQIVTAEPLDREKLDRYSLDITCWDGGRPALVSSVSVPVRVLDTNDQRPRFAQSAYSVRLVENNVPGHELLRVVATDFDLGQNSELHYALAAGVPDGAFEIGPTDGVIRVLRPVNRETYSSFSFAVYAVDHGSPSLTGSALIVVTVEDSNDEFPVFTRHVYEFDVDENQPEAVEFGTVTAVDTDATPTNGMVRYSLVDNDVTSGRFAIDPETGVLRTTTTLDREERAEYRFRVVATDRGQPPLSGMAEVVLRVRDENDNSPVFEFPSTSASGGMFDADTIIISGSVPIGYVVTRAVAHDDDTDENARIRFRFIVRPEDNVDEEDQPFEINSETGEIAVASPFPLSEDRDAVREYQLKIRASDGGHPVRWAEAEMRIVVNGSVPFANGASFVSGLTSRRHVIILVAIIGGSALLTLLLLVAIALVRMRGRKSRRRRHSDDSRRQRRTEAQQALTGNGSGGGLSRDPTISSETVPLSSSKATILDDSSPSKTVSDGRLGNGTSHVINGGYTVSLLSKSPTRHMRLQAPADGTEPDDSQHSGDAGSNADSGRGHSAEEEDNMNSSSGSGSAAGCCHPSTLRSTSGFYRPAAHYLPPPPPPRFSAGTLPHPGQRGTAGSTFCGRPLLPAHHEAVCCGVGDGQNMVSFCGGSRAATSATADGGSGGYLRKYFDESSTSVNPHSTSGNDYSAATLPILEVTSPRLQPSHHSNAAMQNGNGNGNNGSGPASIVWNCSTPGLIV